MEINRNNYESFFLLCLDRELSPAEKSEVDRFLIENADLQKEFVLLQQTILTPVEVVFEPKELLLRKEDKRTVPMYWMRFAAAVVVLLMGGWILIATLKNHEPDITGKTGIAETNSAKQEVPAATEDKNNTEQKNKTLLSPVVLKNETEKLNHENASAQNKTVKSVESEKANISGEVTNAKKSMSPVEQQNPDVHEVSDEPELAMKKSNTTLDLQSGSTLQEKDTKQIAAVTGLNASALVLTAGKTNNLIAYEHAEINEPDFKTDNAISVVALNDNNKAIAGFFKKLTKRAPADETTKNTRKLRVSVFQISY